MAATVINVTSVFADGTHGVDTVIPIKVVFSEAVTVTGTPQLTLETGITDAVVDFTSGSGTDTLVFDYTVTLGDLTADLEYFDTASLALNGGTIKDGGSVDADLTLPTIGGGNSLSDNKALVITTVVFPNAIDDFLCPSPTDKLNNIVTPHALIHCNIADAIEAIENLIGITGSGKIHTHVWNETPTGLINGVNVTYTLSASPNPANSLQVLVNGLLQREGAGQCYTLSGTTLTLNTALLTGDELIVHFQLDV